MILYQTLVDTGINTTYSWSRQKIKAIELAKRMFRKANEPDAVAKVTVFHTADNISSKELIIRVLNGADDWYKKSEVIFTVNVDGKVDGTDAIPVTEVVSEEEPDAATVPYTA